MRFLIVLLFSFILNCSSIQKDQKQINGKSNVLFIMVDDLRDWTNYTTQFSNVKTPNLDRLASQGMVFTSAHCAAPVCAPSRTALMTGLSPAKTGIYENGQIWQGELRQTETLTQKFMNSGYHVAGFGKIYHGQGDIKNWHEFVYGAYSPLPKVWENFYALGNPLAIDDSLTGDYKRVSNAINVLQQEKNKPLFLACGLIRPHTPWNVPQQYFDLYDVDDIEIPEILEGDITDLPPIAQKIVSRMHHDHYGKSFAWTHEAIVDSGLWKLNIRAYLASITYADAQIGRLLDAWEKSPYSENGIIVLMGDHGWHHGEKDHWSKRTLWDIGTRTPLIISAKGITKPGRQCSTPVSLIDLYPTLVDLCHLDPKEGLDGISLKPLLKNPRAKRNHPAITIWGQNNVAVRMKNWRYIQYCDGTNELYNHQDDVHEWNNLLYQDRRKYEKTVQNMKKWLPDCVAASRFNKKRVSWFAKEAICQD